MLVGLPVAVVATFTAGYFFDILGRRATLFLSFFIGSGLVVCIPYTSPKVFPSLLIVRILISLCLAAPGSNPLLADYVHKDAIGKGAAFVGLGFVIGEVLAMAVLFNITKQFTAENAFLTAASVGALLSICFLFLVKEP